MKLRKKTLCAGVLLVPAGLLALAHFYYTVDDPPLEDADLSPAYEAVPYEENGLPLIQEAGDVQLPDDIDIRDMDMDRNWNGDVVREILEMNRPLLAKVDEALKRPRFQVPPVTGPDQVISWGDWPSTADLLSLRLQALFLEGKEREALDEAVGLVRWGHQLESADGPSWVWAMGYRIKVRGLVWFRRVFAKSRLPAGELEYLSRLALYPANDAGFVKALKFDYRIQCECIDRLARGDESLLERMMDLPGMSRVLGVGYLLNPNRTKRLFAGAYRQLLLAVSRSPEHQPAGDSHQHSTGHRILRDLGIELSLLPRKNAGGRTIFAMEYPEDAQRLTMIRSENLWFARTILFLACRCYREHEGKLPASLDDLTPRYLKQVPLDPYDGRPLRYSAERKIIWSVGEDLKDGGGSSLIEEASMQFDPDEPTFSIDFRTPAARN